MTGNHFKPDYPNAARQQHENIDRLWTRLEHAYTAAGLDTPTKPDADASALFAGLDMPADVLDTLAARYAYADTLTGADLEEYRQRWLDATFHERARNVLAQNARTRTANARKHAIGTALPALAAPVTALADTLAIAAGRLNRAAPLDAAAAVDAGTVDDLTTARDTLAALAAIASLHDDMTSTRPQNLWPVIKLAAVLDLPADVGYPEPRSVEDVANGVGLTPRPGQVATLALIEAAADPDMALIRVARGDLPGVRIALATDRREFEARIVRIVHATDYETSRPYTYENALKHRQGKFTGAGQRIDDWAIYVIAHQTGTNPEHVTAERMPVRVH